jgi:hypothetical protein
MTDYNQTSPCLSRVEALKHVTAKDGIYLNFEGYKLMAKNLISEAESMARFGRQSVLPAKAHYWRGFKSQAGSCVPTGSYAQLGRGVFPGQRGNRKAKPYHPYKKR